MTPGAMPIPTRLLRIVVLGVPLLVAGCGGVDGVQLNGGLFDIAGLTGKSATASDEPRLAERPGIVLPPAVKNLPQPGSGALAAAAIETGTLPINPETQKVAQAQAAQKQQDDFCKAAFAKAKAYGREPVGIQGPAGVCSQSVLKNLGAAVDINAPVILRTK